MRLTWSGTLLSLCAAGTALSLLILGLGAPLARADETGPRVAFSLRDDRITEASGLAASRRHKGVYWTHNDSDDGPYVYAVDSKGRTVATVALRGVEPRDLEAISVGRGGQIYVGDIGDNEGVVWPEVWVYRFTEPARLADTTVDVVRYRVRYEDGPRDAEALMADPRTGRIIIASKEEDGGALYQGPEKLSPTTVNTFRRLAKVPWVTDGAISPDGTRMVLRGYFWANQYRWDGGRLSGMRRIALPVQRQGESVTYRADGGAALYGSEGPGSQVWEVRLASEDPSGDTLRKPSGEEPAADEFNGGGDKDITVGFAVFVIALACALGLRALIRK